MYIKIGEEIVLKFLNGSDALANAPAVIYEIVKKGKSAKKQGHFLAFIEMLGSANEQSEINLNRLQDWYYLLKGKRRQSQGFRKATAEEQQELGQRSALPLRLNEILKKIQAIIDSDNYHYFSVSNLKNICSKIYAYHQLDPFIDDHGRTTRLLINYVFLRLRWSFLIFSGDEQAEFDAAFRNIESLTVYLYMKMKERFISLAGAIGEQESYENHSSTYRFSNDAVDQMQIVEWHLFDSDIEQLTSIPKAA